jgi:hypothetical protein
MTTAATNQMSLDSGTRRPSAAVPRRLIVLRRSWDGISQLGPHRGDVMVARYMKFALVVACPTPRNCLSLLNSVRPCYRTGAPWSLQPTPLGAKLRAIIACEPYPI